MRAGAHVSHHVKKRPRVAPMSPATPTSFIDAQPHPLRESSIREFAKKAKGMAEASIRRRVGTARDPELRKVGGARRIPLSYLEKVGAWGGHPAGRHT